MDFTSYAFQHLGSCRNGGLTGLTVAVTVVFSSCFLFGGHDGARFTLVNPSQTPADNNWALQLWSVDAQGREFAFRRSSLVLVRPAGVIMCANRIKQNVKGGELEKHLTHHQDDVSGFEVDNSPIVRSTQYVACRHDSCTICSVAQNCCVSPTCTSPGIVKARADKTVRLLDNDYAVAMEFKTSRDCGGADWVGSGIWGDTVCLMKARVCICVLEELTK